MSPSHRDGLLAAAAFLGRAAALWSALGTPQPKFWGAQDAVAMVDGTVISRLDYERALAAVAGDRRTPLRPEDRTRILDTLIAEALLVNRALDLDLVRADNGLRKAAVDASLRSAGSNLDDPPTEADLLNLYQADPSLFSPAPLVRLRWARAEPGDDAERVAAAIKDGVPFSQALERHGLTRDNALPDRLLETEKLTDYVPASIARLAIRLPAGTIAGPIDVAGAQHFLWIVERQDPARPAFADVQEALAEIWQRRQDEARAAELIRRLRAAADVVILEDPAP